jgi:hypothetical protein
MHGHGPREDPLPDMGYEVRDIDIAKLRTTAIIFFVFSMFCFVVVAIWYVWYGPKMEATIDPRKPMPAIQLQSNISTRSDIATFRQAETERLSTSGQNPDGSYHIPIGAAMDLIATKGLPRTLSSTAASSPGNTVKYNALPPGEHANPADQGPIQGGAIGNP